MPRACSASASCRADELDGAAARARRARRRLPQRRVRARCALRGRPFGDRGAPDRAPRRRRPHDPHRPQPQRPGAGRDAPVAEGRRWRRCSALCRDDRQRRAASAPKPTARCRCRATRTCSARSCRRPACGGPAGPKPSSTTRSVPRDTRALDRCQSARHRRRLRRQPAAGSRRTPRRRWASRACRCRRSMRSCRAASSNWRRWKRSAQRDARPAPAGLGPEPVHHRGVRFRRAAGAIHHRQFDHAEQAQSRRRSN